MTTKQPLSQDEIKQKKGRHKTVFLVRTDLPNGQVANAAVHSALQMGALTDCYSGSELTDIDGNTFAGLPIIPNLVLGVSANEMLEAFQHLMGGGAHEYVPFFEEGFSTSNDDELLEVISQKSTKNLMPLTILAVGTKKQMNRLTKVAGSPTFWQGKESRN